MICPACGHKHIEPGDHRCPRCGRRLDRPSPRISETPPTPPVTTGAAAPQWRQEVSERLEQFRHKRARQHAPEDEGGEVVPPPDPQQKILAFEDFAAERIEPLIVESPPGSRRAAEKPKAAPAAAPPEPLRVAEPPDEEVPSRENLYPHPVAPVALRGVAAALDLAVTLVAIGLFFAVFHLLGGILHFNQKAGAAMALATGCLVAFYLFVYICYAGETPGMQWTGLCVLDYEGDPPHAGQRLARALGSLLSAAALGLGYLWALIDEEGLTWHDRISKTFVTHDPRAQRRFRPRR